MRQPVTRRLLVADPPLPHHQPHFVCSIHTFRTTELFPPWLSRPLASPLSLRLVTSPCRNMFSTVMDELFKPISRFGALPLVWCRVVYHMPAPARVTAPGFSWLLSR